MNALVIGAAVITTIVTGFTAPAEAKPALESVSSISITSSTAAVGVLAD